MRASVLSVLSALVLFSISFANGGPIDGSRALGAGSIELSTVDGVELRSEDLSFVVRGDYVDVVAVYELENTGAAREVDFAFPVDFVTDFEEINELSEASTEPLEEVVGFTMTLDGVPLEISRVVADSSEVELAGWVYTRSSLWHVSTLHLEDGATHSLRVAYSFRPFFMDAAFSKSWFPSWGTRSFTYRVDPAGGWGDGTVDSFSCSIDISALMHTGDSYSLPEGGNWITPTVYGWSWTDRDLRSTEPLRVSFTVDNAKDSSFLLENLLDVGDVVVMRTSSELPAQGGNNYGSGNLLDMDFSTTWCPGGPDGGVGSWVELEMMRPCLVGALFIANGYTKSGEAYSANSRVRSARLTLTGDPDNQHGYGVEGVVFDEVITLEDEPWTELDQGNFARGLQLLFTESELGEAVSSIRLEILEVYPGDVWNDLCISELVISGYDAEDFERWNSY